MSNDALMAALVWYADEAEALARHMRSGAHSDAVLASLTVLSLDGGSRARAALSERPAPSVPDGWQLVPVDPTPAMMKEADRIIGHDPRFMRMTWCAMLKAAPVAADPAADVQPTRGQQRADAGFTRRPGLWAMQAREALELIAAPQRPDGTWNRDREACRQLAAEALGRYDDALDERAADAALSAIAAEREKANRALAAQYESRYGVIQDGLLSQVQSLTAELYALRGQLEEAVRDAAKSERRAIAFGDVLGQNIIAMRAAVVCGHTESPVHGLQWIVNSLAGPGQLPDLDEAIALGGAQALFDKEMADQEAFRAAHPAPAITDRVEAK